MKKQPDKFERMIMDMGDPPFEGIEVYAKFRQYHREVVELVKKELAEAIEERRMDSFELLLEKLEELAK